jgi:hypothetical protein
MNGGLFFKMGFNKLQRKEFFYTICIFIRLLLSGIVYNFSDNKYLQYSLLFISLISIYSNYQKIDENVWWNRHFHLLIGIILLIISYKIIKKEIKETKYLAYILYVDVIFGILDSFYKRPFD